MVGSIALKKIGAGGSIDMANVKDPIIVIILGQKGLIYNLTIESPSIKNKKVRI
jgi:hypothetical protein